VEKRFITRHQARVRREISEKREKYFHVRGEKSEEFICARNLSARQSDKRRKKKQANKVPSRKPPTPSISGGSNSSLERKQRGKTSRSSGKKG
jgi:hypothetical protein